MTKFHAYHNVDKQGQFGECDFYTSFRTNVGDSLYVVLGKANKSTKKSDYYLAGKYVVKSVQANDSIGALAKKKWHLEIKVVSNLESPVLFSNHPEFDRGKYLNKVISTGGFKRQTVETTEFFHLFDGMIDAAELSFGYNDLAAEQDQNNDENSTLNKVMRSILERRGQPKFRRDLLKLYDNRCCITNCTVMELLEAAHINPFSEDGDNSLSNGFILRADIHTLFDRGLLTVDGNCVVRISKDLFGSEYASLNGTKIQRNPAALPSEFSLRKRYESFMERENSLR